ncbi:hypothetical protein QC762_600765 [Podospora pseudocomata]|uniref:Uncharacterized protein n=1 Tax=Podospora pseudocomata TaxID=2093779 RepID=A0ABR0G7L4_9PEZI|nr:hypothetical protein QC762_600765 [Podospora pseudocomata]
MPTIPDTPLAASTLEERMDSVGRTQERLLGLMEQLRGDEEAEIVIGGATTIMTVLPEMARMTLGNLQLTDGIYFTMTPNAFTKPEEKLEWCLYFAIRCLNGTPRLGPDPGGLPLVQKEHHHLRHYLLPRREEQPPAPLLAPSRVCGRGPILLPLDNADRLPVRQAGNLRKVLPRRHHPPPPQDPTRLCHAKNRYGNTVFLYTRDESNPVVINCVLEDAGQNKDLTKWL